MHPNIWLPFSMKKLTYFLSNIGLSPRSPTPTPLNFHYSYNVKDCTYLPKYDQPEKLNARIRVKHVIWNTDWVCRQWMCVDMCMLQEVHTWNCKEQKLTCSIQFRFLLMTYSKMWSWKTIARTHLHISEISVYEMQTFTYTDLTVDSISFHFLA